MIVPLSLTTMVLFLPFKPVSDVTVALAAKSELMVYGKDFRVSQFDDTLHTIPLCTLYL